MIKEKIDLIKEKLVFLKWLDPFTYLEIILRKFHPKKENPSMLDEGIDFAVYVVSALIFAFLLYSFFGFVLHTNSPMVIVSSASMVPEMYRGDIIVLYGSNDIKSQEITVNQEIGNKLYSEYGTTFPVPVQKYIDPSSGKIYFEFVESQYLEIENQKIPLSKEGDVIVYFSPYSNKDIIHRAALKINAPDGTFYLTKGDANPTIDQECVSEVINGKQIYIACITENAIPPSSIKGKAIFRIPLLGCAKLWVFDNIPLILSGKPNPDFYGIC